MSCAAVSAAPPTVKPVQRSTIVPKTIVTKPCVRKPLPSIHPIHPEPVDLPESPDGIVSASEANQNFSRVTRIADAQGQAVIFKNNKPKYLLVDIESTPYFDMTDDEKIDVIAARILKKFKPAFEELAK